MITQRRVKTLLHITNKLKDFRYNCVFIKKKKAKWEVMLKEKKATTCRYPSVTKIRVNKL